MVARQGGMDGLLLTVLLSFNLQFICAHIHINLSAVFHNVLHEFPVIRIAALQFSPGIFPPFSSCLKLKIIALIMPRARAAACLLSILFAGLVENNFTQFFPCPTGERRQHFDCVENYSQKSGETYI